jgi:hypothetical protein
MSSVATSANHALESALQFRAASDWPALERFCIESLRQFPHDIELSWQLSHCYWRRHDVASALAVMQACAAHHPLHAGALSGVAFCLLESARYEEAETTYRRAFEMAPNNVDIAVDLADLELRRGAWSEGWARFDRRLSRERQTGNVVLFAESHAPRWRGEPLVGKRVVVYSELGLGDDLQFVRFYPRFADAVRNAGGHAQLAVRPPLLPLVKRFVPDCVVVERDAFEAADFSVGMMSVPYWIGLMPDDVHGAPYLQADPHRVGTWRGLLNTGDSRALRVGLVWAGSPTHRRDSQRSIPVGALAPLWHLPNIAFYPVAPGRDADVENMRASGASIVDVTQHYREDFHDSAALLTALDVLVTIDSSPLHLGGALGRPVLAMIDHASHWCWGVGETQPWYDSVRLIRQEKAGDWQPVVVRVAAELTRLQQASAGVRRG